MKKCKYEYQIGEKRTQIGDKETLDERHVNLINEVSYHGFEAQISKNNDDASYHHHMHKIAVSEYDDFIKDNPEFRKHQTQYAEAQTQQ